MTVVTLTTDFGLKDYYVSILKGALFGLDASLSLVDITHQINNYDIVQAAFIFRNAWRHFPQGTIHLLSVNDLGSPNKRFLVLQQEGHYFVGPDNGLLSLIFQPFSEAAYEIPFSDEKAFPMIGIFKSAVEQLISGKNIEEIGQKAEGIVQRITFQPVIGPSYVRGTVIYIDNYDNVIVNITKSLFEQVGRGRAFSLFFKRHDPITTLSRQYYDVPVGETLCLFNSAGLIEIAINMGKAGSLLGLKVEDTIQIDFHDPVSPNP